MADVRIKFDSQSTGSIEIDGADIADAVEELHIDAFGGRPPKVTLVIRGKVELDMDGSTVHLEYPHEVKKFFPGKQFQKPVAAIKEKE